MACEYFNADLGLAIVRAEHQAFYRRVFLHETMAEPRMFPGLLKPVGLMAADFPAMKEKVFERFPFMRSTAFERRMLFERAGGRAAPAGPCRSPHTSVPRSSRIPEPAGLRIISRPARVGFRPPGNRLATMLAGPVVFRRADHAIRARESSRPLPAPRSSRVPERAESAVSSRLASPARDISPRRLDMSSGGRPFTPANAQIR